MAKPDWLSIEEISRLWGEETGSDPAAFRQDLEAWFSDFVKQSPGSQAPVAGNSADTTNRLMGMLGARYLERQTFEAFCEERGHPKPRFWYSGPIEPSQRAATRQPGPRATELGEDSPSQSVAGDLDLESFQRQIAGMSERLRPPSFEFRNPAASVSGDLMDPGSPPQPSAPSSEHNHQELIERAEAAAAEARQLEAQLEAAERRIAELDATTHENRIPSPAPPEFAAYQTPSATGQRLRQGTRRRSRGWAALAAGLAVAVIAAAALLTWAPENGLRITDGAPGPASAERDQAAASVPAEARNLALAQQQIARLAAAVEASKSEAARLQAELAVARQTLESTRQARPSGAEDASNSRAALQGAEEKLAALKAELAAARGATDTARAETARLRTAMLQAKGQTDAELQVLSLATTASSARIAALQRDLAAARQEIAALGRDKGAAIAEASSLRADLAAAERKIAGQDEELESARGGAAENEQEVAALREELAAARGTAADADTRAAEAEAEAVRLRTALQQATDQTGSELRDQSLAVAVSSARLAELQRDLAAARKQIADLRRGRSAAGANESGLRASLQKARDESEALREELAREESELARLRSDLDAAQLRIDELNGAVAAAEGEAARLRQELAVRRQEATAAGTPASEPAGAERPAPARGAAGRAARPGSVSFAAAETGPADTTSGAFEQVAALPVNEAALLTDAIADTVSPDDLLRAPARHLGQEVVVTGSVVWLLWRYRLQSNGGSDSIVVDVDGLQPAAQRELENAIDRVGILGEVQARIRGTVLRKDEESYRLAASELELVE